MKHTEKNNISILYKLFAFLIILQICSCKKLNEYNQKPELSSLQQGLKTSAAIGYCSSIAMSAFKGDALPGNVAMISKSSDQYRSSWLLYIKIDNSNPLPFNSNVGDIIIAGIGDEKCGIISILFGDFDLLNTNVKLFGIQTVPVIEREDLITGKKNVIVMFAKEDFIIGNTSTDAVLNIDFSDMQFKVEMDRLSTPVPSDAFVAVKQNIWFIRIDQAGTSAIVFDDNLNINGGGQILEADGESGGIIYHAIINAKINYSVCTENPISGYALSQNFKAGGEPGIDLGGSFLSFHKSCDGTAHVDFSTGKYISYNNKNITLNLN
jgi:hypothetical protein